MLNFLIAVIVIFFLLGLWLVVMTTSRHFSERHPEYGPYREEGKGCGSSCSCTGECEFRKSNRRQSNIHQGNTPQDKTSLKQQVF